MLVTGLSDAAWLDPTGEIAELSFEDAAARINDGIRPILCHAPATARRLALRRFQCFDVLELFAFVRPLDFCIPTPRGLGETLGIESGHRPSDGAIGLIQAPRHCCENWARPTTETRARLLGQWRRADGVGGLRSWRHLVRKARPIRRVRRLRARRLAPPAGMVGACAAAAAGISMPVEPEERGIASTICSMPMRNRGRARRTTRLRLRARSGRVTRRAHRTLSWRKQERASARHSVISRPPAFGRKRTRHPFGFRPIHGTYNQIDQELDRLYPDPALKARRVVVRKGRENYLCLLEHGRSPARCRGGSQRCHQPWIDGALGQPDTETAT